MDNLEEMDKFLEIYNLTRLNQEEIENLNRSITSKEMKSVIKNVPNKEKPRTRLLHWSLLHQFFSNSSSPKHNVIPVKSV